MTRTFATAAADLLLVHGPLTVDELHAFALEQGLTLSKKPASLVQRLTGETFVRRPDGRYDTAARLLRGQVFTTRLRGAPAGGVLWTYRDLDALGALPGLPLVHGGELRRGQGPVECWTGPAGWLPPLPDGALLGLRWDGHGLTVTAVDDVPEGDSHVVRDVREVLARHSRAERRYGWPGAPLTSLTAAVVSALVEDPALFAQPLPPLRELLPLPEDLRPQDGAVEHDPQPRQVVGVPLSARVHDELARRADRSYERLPDYLSMLLGAAADRVQPSPRDQYLDDLDDRPYLSSVRYLDDGKL